MRVLICDDNRDGADTLALLLRSHGHEVKTCYEGHSCLSDALKWKPVVAFLDIGMPRVTGHGVARKLRAAFGSDILLVAVTAYGSPQDRLVSFESGFDMHLAKPVEPDRILSIAASGIRAREGPTGRGV